MGFDSPQPLPDILKRVAMAKHTNSTEKDPYNQFLITEYLKLGSVDAVFKKHGSDIYVSYPTFARLRKTWNGHGIVEKAGPNSNVSELFHILSILADSNMSLESLYRQRIPRQIRTSIHTCYRVLQKIKEGTIRRHGTVLIITPEKDPNKILVGNDISLKHTSFGKSGDISFPITYSKRGENPSLAIRRVLEREVFTQSVIDGTFPYHLIPQKISPFTHIVLADILVQVFHLPIPKKYLKNFSSFKIQDHSFIPLKEIIHSNPQNHYRPGLSEISQLYSQYLIDPQSVPQKISPKTCQLNQRLAYTYT